MATYISTFTVSACLDAAGRQVEIEVKVEFHEGFWVSNGVYEEEVPAEYEIKFAVWDGCHIEPKEIEKEVEDQIWTHFEKIIKDDKQDFLIQKENYEVALFEVFEKAA